MAFFDDLQAMAHALLKPDAEGGLGSAAGSIVMKRSVPGTPNPVTPWLPVVPVVTQETLKAQSFGVPQKMIDGVTILHGDQYVISAVPALDWRQGVLGAVVTIEIDARVWQVVSVTDVPAAGTRSAIKFMIRSTGA